MNGYKSILLHLDASPDVARRMRVASMLAASHAAELEVLYAVMPTMMQYPFAFTTDAQVATLLAAFESESRERAKLAFDEARRAAGMPALPWAEATDEPLRAFSRRAFAADLLVLAQHDPNAKASSCVPADFAASVLIETGKPGLLLPYIETDSSLGQTVLVAWKPTPQAARAVHFALPILRRARQVHVAVWDETPGEEEGAAPAIERFLARHGVAPTLHQGGSTTRDLGELLLSLAADVQADMLVMGCYGHGRAREWALGGVTRTVIRGQTLPVLMAH